MLFPKPFAAIRGLAVPRLSKWQIEGSSELAVRKQVYQIENTPPSGAKSSVERTGSDTQKRECRYTGSSEANPAKSRTGAAFDELEIAESGEFAMLAWTERSR